MAFTVVVPYKSKTEAPRRIKVDVKNKENAIAQARQSNPEVELDWDEAEVQETDT